MAEEKFEEKMDVRKEDLLLSFYDALMDYDVHKDIIVFRDRLIEQAILNAYDDATRQGAFYAFLYSNYLKEFEEKLPDSVKKEVKDKSWKELMKNEKVKPYCEKFEKCKAEDAEKAKKRAYNKIKENILSLLKEDKDYCKWHAGLCCTESKNSLMEIYKKEDLIKAFTVGNAQKWVNMTMKYLYVYATILSKMKEFSNCNPLQNIIDQGANFHVPLDSIILKAVFREELRNSINTGDSPLIKETELIKRIQKNVRAYNKLHNGVNSEGAFVAKAVECLNEGETDTKKMVEPVTWSKIGTYGAYEKIQEEVKACIPSEYKERPLEWENKVWLAASRVKPGESEE